MTDVAVQRHRTAMVRHTLSQPMSLAVRYALVGPGVTVFDYGCGQGDDLRALEAAGVEAAGWDPHFAPDKDLIGSDVVNLGFVLNVIEEPAERLVALNEAWRLTRRLLIVSVMVVGAVPVDGLRRMGDGYLTSRGTFQKYFQQAELKALIAQTIGIEPIALAPGIFAAFRIPEDEQDFLLARRRGRRSSTAAYRVERPQRLSRNRPPLADRISSSLTALRNLALEHGRPPHPDEVPAAIHEELVTERVSFARALELSLDDHSDIDAIRAVGEQRREDLLVHQALNILNRTRSAARFSPAMMRDIRHHFGSQQQLAEQALEYLHALADAGRSVAAMKRAADAGIGTLDEDGRLVVPSSRMDELEGTLRCYHGCAVHLSGDLTNEHLVRLDPLRRRTTLFPLLDRRVPFPMTSGSVTIDLKRQDVVVRDDPRVLVRKADVFGLPAKSRQRHHEAVRRADERYAADCVLLRSG